MESFRPANHAPTLVAGLLAGLEALINDTIRLDAASLQKINKLGEQWVQLTVEPFGETFFLCTSNPIRLTTELAGEPDVAISGSPVSLIRFFRDAEATKRLTISGQWSLAAQLADISKRLEIDWESKFAGPMGNLPAHFVGERVRRTLHWLSYTQQNFFRDAEEYIHHESGVLPDKEEVKLWQQDVTATSSATEDLEQRLYVLKQRLLKFRKSQGGHNASTAPNQSKEG